MKLEMIRNNVYRVKKGQTAAEIALAFGVPPRVLASYNHLTQEAEEGQILFLPDESGNLYLVRGGESKSLLCGSKERFEERNKTKCFYPLQIVLL